MRFKYKYSIEIETELELPIVGYNVDTASVKLTDDEVKFVLERCIQDPRPNQTFDLSTRVYKVKKGSKLTNIQMTEKDLVFTEHGWESQKVLEERIKMNKQRYQDDDDYPGLTE